MHLNTIFTAFWKKSESWNLAVAAKSPTHVYIIVIRILQQH